MQSNLKVLQINTIVNSGSTGRIAEDIGKVLMQAGYESYIAAAYTGRPSNSEVIPVGSGLDRKLHGLKTRLFDRHGFASPKSTSNLLKKIDEIQPDIIHLHNIHGYYLHAGILFSYLKKANIPIVWTFHDCWPFTGHCAYFDMVNCFKWEQECNHCPNINAYPASWHIDNSKRNFHDKKRIFNGVNNLQIITPSRWLKEHVKSSFLKDYPVTVIHNGIDLEVFKSVDNKSILEKHNIGDKNIILGVASTWDKRKGMSDFIQISKMVQTEDHIVLVGLTEKQIKSLPGNITGIPRTESIDELAELYSSARVFVNPTYVDNFPTTNLEALACGTPVITYETGGSSEAVDENTGIVVEKGNNAELLNAIHAILSKSKETYTHACRKRAETYYDKKERFTDYLNLYHKINNS